MNVSKIVLILIGLVSLAYAMEEMVAKDKIEPKDFTHDLEGAEGKRRGYYGGYGGGYGGYGGSYSYGYPVQSYYPSYGYGQNYGYGYGQNLGYGYGQNLGYGFNQFLG